MKKLIVGIVALAVLCLLAPIWAEDAETKTEAATMPDVSDMGWFAGNWVIESDTMIIEETWSPPRGNALMASCRFVRGGKLMLAEFIIIEENEDGTFLYLKHYGTAMSEKHEEPIVFRLSEQEENRVLFVNVGEGFPSEYEYRRDGDTLFAEIRGAGKDGSPRKESFPYTRASK